MRRRDCIGALAAAGLAAATPKRRTTVSIHGDMFHINGKPTYAGRRWKGHKIEGLLEWAGVDIPFFDPSKKLANQLEMVRDRAAEYQKLRAFVLSSASLRAADFL